MVVFEAGFPQLAFEVLADGLPRRLEDVEDPLRQNSSTVLGHEDQMDRQGENHMPSRSELG